MSESVCCRCGNPIKPRAFTCPHCGIFHPDKSAVVDAADGRVVCTRCGSVGEPVRKEHGSSGVECFLYLWLIIPGLLYSLWRRSTGHSVCGVCGSTEVVPPGSPVGVEILARPAHAAAHAGLDR